MYRDINNQNFAWYGSSNSLVIANNLMIMQHAYGGWPKGTGQGGTNFNQNIAALTPAELQHHERAVHSTESYFGRGITMHEIRFLMTMYEATKIERIKDSYTRGLEAVLNAQYPGGGWPYYLTDRSGYRGTISFNDDAMVTIMEVFMDITNGDFPNLCEDMHIRVSSSFERGLNALDL
jgi:PelA/Pel-15E family pectate lyase